MIIRDGTPIDWPTRPRCCQMVEQFLEIPLVIWRRNKKLTMPFQYVTRFHFVWFRFVSRHIGDFRVNNGQPLGAADSVWPANLVVTLLKREKRSEC